MLALLLVAISLGVSNCAATGIEVSGIDAHTRLASTLSHAARSIGVASEGAHS